jgi:hypothetical protein
MWRGMFEAVRMEVTEYIDAGQSVVGPGSLFVRSRLTLHVS